MVSTRPANDSALWRDNSGDALPRIRNVAGFPGRSASTRKTGNKRGARCASSTTTNPRSPSKAVIGFSIKPVRTPPHLLRLQTS